MPWARGGKVNPKYLTREHREKRAELKAQLERDGYAQCAQPVCLMRSRLILPGMAWHVGHDDAGTHYIGHVHAQCNVTAAAKAARARQTSTRLRW